MAQRPRGGYQQRGWAAPPKCSRYEQAPSGGCAAYASVCGGDVPGRMGGAMQLLSALDHASATGSVVKGTFDGSALRELEQCRTLQGNGACSAPA
jgi:hypothetical protein